VCMLFNHFMVRLVVCVVLWEYLSLQATMKEIGTGGC
jgi:hypothetical protein